MKKLQGNYPLIKQHIIAKKRGFSDFYREEIRIITDLLNLSPEEVNYIFFAD